MSGFLAGMGAALAAIGAGSLAWQIIHWIQRRRFRRRMLSCLWLTRHFWCFDVGDIREYVRVSFRYPERIQIDWLNFDREKKS